MEYQEQEWDINQDGNHHQADYEKRHDQQDQRTGDALVSPNLLTSVLRRLELTPEQSAAEKTLEDLQARLKNTDWSIRAAAVREMGKQQAEISLDFLTSALNDEDETVRAAAVHVLGNMGRQAPLHKLVEALRDNDWHVRETAVFALSKQGERIPREVINTALYDSDFSVREAARLALQWYPTDNNASVSYGRLWEQKSMQSEQEMASSQKDVGNKTSKLSSEPYEVRQDSRTSHTYSGYAANSHIVREQAQAYAAEEPMFAESASYEYQHEHEVSPQWQKLTPRRSSNKGWWAALIVTAIVSFLLGVAVTAGTITVAGPVPIHMGSSSKGTITNAEPMKHSSFEQLVRDPKFNGIASKEIASALNLSPDAITQQLQTGTSMIDIAASQGVSVTQLHSIEFKAFNDLADAGLKSGQLNPIDAKLSLQRLQNDPVQLDNEATILFSPDTVPAGN